MRIGGGPGFARSRRLAWRFGLAALVGLAAATIPACDAPGGQQALGGVGAATFESGGAHITQDDPASTRTPTTAGAAGRHVAFAPPSASELALIPSQLLPAFETAAEAASLAKGDAADDYRAAHPEWFAQTRPPAAGRFRPYGEWETMQSVWTTYSNGMPSSKAVRRMMAEQTINFVRYSKTPIVAYAIVNNASVGADFFKALDEYGISAAEKQQVKTVTMPNQTIWLMDYSGFPLVDKVTGQVAFADWIYYQPRQLDDALGTRVGADFHSGTVYRVPFPFEGGNIQADGAGQCATTLRALKNTGYSAAKVRDILSQWAACQHTYLLKDITDDGTGHLDMFFKWLSPEHVLIGRYEDSLTLDYDGNGSTETLALPGKVANDYKATWASNQQRMEDNAALFQTAKTSAGGSFKVSRLTMMTRFKDQYGDVPRTFINSTFTNGVNVYPSYTTKSCRATSGKGCMTDAACGTGQHCAAGGCTTGPTARGCDELLGCDSGEVCVADPFKVAITARAQQQWQTAMPAMKHVGLRADSIALWSGAIHCITRTIPKGPITKTVADGLCVQGSCGCAAGGANRSCTDHAQCTGPSWVCNCQICQGTCAGTGATCTHDVDCSGGGAVVLGACNINPKQSCGAGGGGGGSDPCGGVSYEGMCSANALSYCDGTLKKQACQGCCGWDASSSFYNCLTGSACTTCVNECSAIGEQGCSSKGTHAWTCAKVGGCLARQWSSCAAGCSQGKCSGGASGGNMVSQCPVAGTDAGIADSGVSDSGVSDSGAPDSGAPDSGAPDSGAGDSGASDSGAGDSGASDSGISDSAMSDSVLIDSGAADVSPADTAGNSRNGGDASAVDTGGAGADGGAVGSDDAVGTDAPGVDASVGSDGVTTTAVDGLAATDGVPVGFGYAAGGGTRTGCSATRQAQPLTGLVWLLLCAGLLLRRRRA